MACISSSKFLTDLIKIYLERFSNKNLSTLNIFSRAFSRFLHKFNLIIYSRFITCIHPAVHERKPTQVYILIYFIKLVNS